MTNIFGNRLVSTFFCAGLFTASASAAGLTLTSAGIADGFSTSTFATLDPGQSGCCGGPLGIAIANGGNVIVSNGANSTRYAFSDVDGQTQGSALNAVAGAAVLTGYATAGGEAYGTNGSRFVQFNNDGTVNHILTGVAASPFYGMAGNPVNGHIIATSDHGLIDIDPLAGGGAGSYRVIVSGGINSGIAVSLDGQTAYLDGSGQIIGLSIATGMQTYASAALFSANDGIAVIESSNGLNGQLIVNDNGGAVLLLDPVGNIITHIATQNTRGGYVTRDSNDGTLLLAFSDTVERLSCGTGCGVAVATPEPSTAALFGLTAVCLGALRRRLKGFLLRSDARGRGGI